ncbi:hypothetical protein ACIRRH_42685 [Kitasatospora sp. NPDC101235]|uniref:hypothetical protein n=1 Tax=Kitasatospora sp. NPDC101235 TaxID=3364101 RepID=UPI00380D8AD6
MTTPGLHTGFPVPLPDVLPDPWAVLRDTDWSLLDTGFGPGREVPGALGWLLGDDLTAEEAEHVLAGLGLRHQNTIYEATVPAALCVAAVLGHRAEQHPGPADGVCALLLGWLADVAHDFDEPCPAHLQHRLGGVFADGATPR